MKTIDEFLSHLYSLDIKLWVDGTLLRCSVPEEVLTPTLSTQLQERKAEILAFLNQVNLVLHSTHKPIQPVSREGNLLSFAQQRLWFLDQLQPGSVYNIPVAVRLTGSLSIPVLQQTLNEIVRRHETLRTNFLTLEGQPLQVIAPTLNLALPLVDLRNFPQFEREAEVLHLAAKEAQQPFDLTKEPLLRITLLLLDQAEYVVLFTMHHIVSDAWSMGILIRELAVLYEAFAAGKPSPLPDLPIQYADFAAWQRQWLQAEVLEAQLSYWKQQLSGNLPVLQLPTDFSRLRVQTFRGATKSFSLPAELTKALKALSQQENVTLFMTLLAAFKTLLHRYTGQHDILVGSPIANRNRAEIEGLIGFFVNTLVLRTNIAGNPTFRELLHQVRKTTWEAYDHQDLPFEKLVEELQPERDLSYSPLFQVKFMLENAPKEDLNLPGLTLSSIRQENPTAKLDLSLDIFANNLDGHRAAGHSQSWGSVCTIRSSVSSRTPGFHVDRFTSTHTVDSREDNGRAS